jgi:GT2 family glycosyltransferase
MIKEEIDVIILSYAQNKQLQMVTEEAIRSLIESEDSLIIKFNVIVIESQGNLSPYQYKGTTTIYPGGSFGYNKFMNLGISMTSSKFICLCNNDLIFHKNWATEILKPFEYFEDLYSASPICSRHHPSEGILVNSGFRLGYRIRVEVAGWCLFFRRDLLKITGMLDPNFTFWCADNDYTNTLWTQGLKHILVTSSIVDHLANITLLNQTPSEQYRLTEIECHYFEKKWNSKLGDSWYCL